MEIDFDKAMRAAELIAVARRKLLAIADPMERARIGLMVFGKRYGEVLADG